MRRNRERDDLRRRRLARPIQRDRSSRDRHGVRPADRLQVRALEDGRLVAGARLLDGRREGRMLLDVRGDHVR